MKFGGELPYIDVSELEKWLAEVPLTVRVADWNVQALDVWPLFNTCLVSLAILTRIRQRKAFLRVGGRPWQAGVMVDYVAVSPIRWLLGASRSMCLPPDSLEDCILYCGSRVHSRQLGDISVTAPLDVPATLMRRAGHQGIFWFEDVADTEPRLHQSLNQPARGVADILLSASKNAWRYGAARDLDRLPGFSHWCALAARRLSLSTAFLRLWLARQLEFALSASRGFGEVFDAKGRPSLIIMLNGGFASTVGLVAAAKARQIPVVEVQHGADSECAVTSPGSSPHFSTYNSAPDALISWGLNQHGTDWFTSARRGRGSAPQ
jgi:hypothetical protein